MKHIAYRGFSARRRRRPRPPHRVPCWPACPPAPSARRVPMRPLVVTPAVLHYLLRHQWIAEKQPRVSDDQRGLPQ
jgi:hypothetical protein